MLSHFTLASASSCSGCWLQMFMSRSLQQAEVLIRSSFNPSLKWLFWGHGQDQEEKNFVVAHNLVSRSSERLLHLQQALLSVAPQWQLVGSARLSQVNLYSLQCNWIVMGVRRTWVNESSRSLISSKITSSAFWLFNCHFWDEVIILNKHRSCYNWVHNLLSSLPPPPPSNQVCFKGMPDEAGVLLLPSSSSLQGKYRAQWRLLEQRSLLIFIHEYTRRARLAAVYISSVSRLLEHHRQHLAPQQVRPSAQHCVI